MNDRVTVAIPLAEVRGKMKARATPKGRQVDPQARADIAALLGGRLLGEADRGLRLLGAACIAGGVIALALG